MVPVCLEHEHDFIRPKAYSSYQARDTVPKPDSTARLHPNPKSERQCGCFARSVGVKRKTGINVRALSDWFIFKPETSPNPRQLLGSSLDWWFLLGFF